MEHHAVRVNNVYFYFILGKLRNQTLIKPWDIPDSSDDEHMSDDNEYLVPQPLEQVLIPESDQESSSNVESDESEKEEDALSNQPSTSTAPSSNKKKKDKWVWTDDGIQYDETQNSFLGSSTLPQEIMELESPIEFFKYLFPSSAINLMERESNIYATQISPDSHNAVTCADIRKFIGILIYMSVVHLPSTRHYWKEGTYIEKVASVMTCNKFEEIKRFLHFFDKNEEKKPGDTEFDKLQKIRPLLNIIRERLLKVPKEEYLAIDEQMIPTKARTSGIRQYNAKKPHKWGYLNYVLSGASGFSYDFELFGGKHPGPPQNCLDLGVPGNIVQRLLQAVSENLNYKIFIDNWYTSLQLMANLHKKGFLPLGTIQLNRAHNINLQKKDLMKLKRGHCIEKSTVIDDVQISVINWVDNKAVSLCSTYVGKEPMGSVTRFIKQKKAKADIPCPKAISIYNKYMGGVDLLDSMLGFYRIKIRSKKWYHRIFFHMVDLVCVNSWLLWRRRMEQIEDVTYMPLLDFKLFIADILMREDVLVFTPTSRKRGRPLTQVENIKKKQRLELPPIEVAEDGFNHWPQWKKDRQRCKFEGCIQKSQVMCSKCKCYLCLNKDRNCYTSFHT